MVFMTTSLPGGDARKREARLVRAARGARRDARGSLRRGRRPDRRLHALLVLHRRHRNVPGRGGNRAGVRPARAGAARVRAAGRDGRAAGARRRGRRRSEAGPPVRRGGLRRLPAPVKARLSTDGGARGNPGPAAYGFVLEDSEGTVLEAHGEAIGTATNNVAEYRALLAGLERAAELGVDELEVVSDSELMVKQMRGEYRVKNEALRELSLEAARLARQVGDVTYTAVRREHNELADRLVNEALDAV